MTGLREIASAHKLVLIEDMAQAIGATQGKQRAGSCGELACTSFFPSKNLGAYGDGGMVFATDEELGKRVKMIRNHGQQQRYRHDIVGVNSRLDTLQAAILLKKLPHLNKWNARRAEVANLYEQLLTADVEKPVTATGNSHVYHQYSIMVEQRDELREFLSEREIASAIHYPIPLNEQPAYQHYGGEPTPTAHAVAQRIMALPISPWISDQEVAAVCKGVAEFMSG